MFRVVRFLIVLLGVSGAIQALAQPTPLPIQGNLGSISGSGVPYAGIDIQLQNCPSPVSIAGFWGIVQQEYQIQANPSGVVNSTIWPNDLITCNGTTGNSQYLLTYFAGGAVSGTPQCYQVVSTQGLWNLNGPQQPIACSEPAPNPQDKTFNNFTVNGFLQGNNADFFGLVQMGSIELGTASQTCGAGLYQTGMTKFLVPICSSLPSGTGITQLTGPVTATGPGVVASIITPTGVTAGTYTNMTCTVNAAGQVTSCSSGTAPVTAVSATSPVTVNGGTGPVSGPVTIACPGCAGITATQNDVSGSRSLGVPYTVGTVPTFVEVTLSSLTAAECTGAGWTITAQVGATSGAMIPVGQNSVTNDCLGTAGVSFMVPAGWTYEITEATNPSRTPPSTIVTTAWIELPL